MLEERKKLMSQIIKETKGTDPLLPPGWRSKKLRMLSIKMPLLKTLKLCQ
jgi:hypothetical protein